MMGPVMPRSFYSRDPVTVAREVLGKYLVLGERSGRIVEVEAYLGENDEAAHSARGITPRTRVIFGPPGHAYVYFIYGMYHCLNLVTLPEGEAGCVLIRGVEGQGTGPGKLTRAMGITLEHNGLDLTKGPLLVRDAASGAHRHHILTTTRIGIRKGADLPLRFLLRPEN